MQYIVQQLLTVLLYITVVILPSITQADPAMDRTKLTTHYQHLFPELKLPDYANGIYAIDPIARESWEAIEEFPPYEPAISKGETAFNTQFNNGKSYADCFPGQDKGIAGNYPQWDADSKEVMTLAKAINYCRLAHNESALPYKKGQIAELLAYMTFTSRGKPINVTIPDDPAALAAYEEGKKYYYQRRGQLNFSCASCHIQNAGKRIRSEMLSPMLGHTSNWPTYRLKWGEMGTLHRRFIGCHEQIRAKTLPAQSKEYINLEYFMSFVSNGIPVNGPSTRK